MLFRSHQLWVSRQVVKKGYSLILCEDVGNILVDVEKAKNWVHTYKSSSNDEFIKKFTLEVSHII